MDEDKKLEVSAWLTKSQQDLKSAEWLISSPDNLYNAVGFHCQQAAEKAVKAYLTWRDEPFEKTHSLVALISKCLPFDPAFENLRIAATTLTPYAVTFRYPGELPELAMEEAKQAIKLAHQVWSFVLDRIPKDTHPESK